MTKIAITTAVNLTNTKLLNKQFCYYVPQPVVKLVLGMGAIPIVLPIMNPNQINQEVLDSFDGLIIPGGADIAAKTYHEEPHINIGTSYYPRDQFEQALIKQTLTTNKPILGICRGMQMINVALGGTVYQDLRSEYPDLKIQHAQTAPGFLPTHEIKTKAGTWLAQIIGKQVWVNSRHHQAIKKLGEGLTVSATAPDGVIEGIETANGQVMGVQWHPENLYETQVAAQNLFQNFLQRSELNLQTISTKDK